MIDKSQSAEKMYPSFLKPAYITVHHKIITQYLAYVNFKLTNICMYDYGDALDEPIHTLRIDDNHFIIDKAEIIKPTSASIEFVEYINNVITILDYHMRITGMDIPIVFNTIIKLAKEAIIGNNDTFDDVFDYTINAEKKLQIQSLFEKTMNYLLSIIQK